MKILELDITGIYRFDNTKFKFYTNRYKTNPYRDKGEYSKSSIYPKDINIIIGGNATGKTTLSKSMLLIERLLAGFSLSPFEISNLSEEFSFKIKYLMNKNTDYDYVFEYMIEGKGGKVYEKLSFAKFDVGDLISKTIQIDGKKVKLYNSLYEIDSKEFSFDRDVLLQSKIMNPDRDNDNYELINLAKNIGYRFSHLEFGNTYFVEPKKKIPEQLLSQFLKSVDKSISGVKYTKEDKSDFYITFNNDEELLVDHSNLQNSGKRLSYGTVESIIFLFKVYEILQGGYNTVYIDEELSHLQCELEKVLLLTLIEYLPDQSQLFFTTHNTELLKIDLPFSCYTILSEDDFGNTISTHVDDYLISNGDRNSLFNYVKSNYFDTEKYYDNLYDVFGRMVKNEK